VTNNEIMVHAILLNLPTLLTAFTVWHHCLMNWISTLLIQQSGSGTRVLVHVKTKGGRFDIKILLFLQKNIILSFLW